MTTFDDTGIFELVDDDDQGEHEPSRRGARVVVVLVVAAALVASGIGWLALSRTSGGTAAQPLSVEVLERAAQPTDALPAEVVDEAGIDPTSSRFVVRTTAGQHYAALRWNGDLCLVAVPDGDTPRALCVAPSPTASVTVSGPDDSRVRLGTDGAPAPDTAEGWRAAGTNVWVLDAPAAG